MNYDPNNDNVQPSLLQKIASMAVDVRNLAEKRDQFFKQAFQSLSSKSKIH